MSLRERTRSGLGIIEPCLPSPAKAPPSGPGRLRVPRTPIEQRKRKLAKLICGPHPDPVINEVFEGDGDVLFAHACKLGCEGIVSKRLGSAYRSGRSPNWVKVKNPKAPAVGREAEQDWGR